MSFPKNNELFGHEKGAFTGTDQQHKGLFETASGGTLFLDEIGELPMRLQPKLSRVLQENEIRRVGGTEQIPVSVRVLAATNTDLTEAVAAGKFRGDLYERLKPLHIQLPALRERREDIPALAKHFLIKENNLSNQKVVDMKNLKNHMNDETRIAEAIKEMERIAWRVEWIERMTELSRELDAKYPDLVELATVPPKEWVSRYPTEVASEFKSRIHPLITEIPAQFRSNFLVSAKAHVAQHWNSEVADMLEKQGVFYTDNAPCTQNHRDDEIRDAVETAFVELETEALPLEKLDELERSAWRVKWNEKMTELSRELDAKYPDLVELATVPPKEWVSRYPTKEAFDALGERIDAMRSEFKTRLDTLVAEMPAPFRAQFRAVGKIIVKKIWGDEVAELLEKEGTF